MARLRRGEVRWYRFGASDKRRPVLVRTRDSVLEYLGEVTMEPLITILSAARMESGRRSLLFALGF